MGAVTNPARKQRAIVAHIRSAGGSVQYDWQSDGRVFGAPKPIPGPRWLRRIVGDEPFQQVKAVHLIESDASELSGDEEVALISREIPKLQSLSIDGLALSEQGIRSIASLRRLNWLYLNGTAVTEESLAHLGSLKELKSVTIASTSPLTDTALTNLGRIHDLEELAIFNSKFTDAGMASLPRLTRLRSLLLHTESNQISDDGLSYILEMPSLRILQLKIAGTLISTRGPDDDEATPREEIQRILRERERASNKKTSSARDQDKATPLEDIRSHREAPASAAYWSRHEIHATDPELPVLIRQRCACLTFGTLAR
jgi:hypothetical protein